MTNVKPVMHNTAAIMSGHQLLCMPMVRNDAETKMIETTMSRTPATLLSIAKS